MAALLERLNKEVAAPRVATLFPRKASLLRLVTVIFQEACEDEIQENSISTWKPTNRLS